MDIPKVSDCSVTDCAYNTGKSCHAMAITVGADPDEPVCDTYFTSTTHGGIKAAVAGVGACKAAECQYNEALECTASSINVGYRGNQPDCLTFELR